VVWIDKALDSATASGDDLLIKVAEAEALWIRTHFGFQEESALSQLQEMLDFFESDFPDSFIVYGLLWSLAAHCRTIGAYEKAITYGRRCLNLTINWQDLGWISAAEESLARIYLQMDQPGDAAHHILDLLEWHLAIGQVWQTLGFFYAKSRDFPELIGGNDTAVSIMSMVYHHPESFPGYKLHIEEARPRFEKEMGTAAFSDAWGKGKALDFETAVERIRTALREN
jgi:tetratricopeptide (TPR) repeat protein